MPALPKIPASVVVLGTTWRVKCVPEWEKGTFGYTNPTTHVIKISTRSPIAEQWSTLLHELVHAALHTSGLTEILCPGGKGPTEEAVVMCLESTLVPLLRQHGALIQRGLRHAIRNTRNK